MAAFTIAPDGEWVVYATCEYLHPQAAAGRMELDGEWSGYGHSYELARIRIDGTAKLRLTENSRFDNFPAWSPDGTRIAHLGSNDPWTDNDLYSGVVVGPNLHQIEAWTGDFVPHTPQWAPSGDSLAVVGKGGPTGRVIYLVGADGRGRKLLTETVSGPSWSPDGTRLAFAKPDGETVALFTMAVDGTDAQRVTTIEGWQPRDWEPDPSRAWIDTVAWSPDGSMVLYRCGWLYCVVTPDGMPIGKSPVIPGVHSEFSAASWAPDSSRIAVSGDSEPVLNPGDIVVYTMAPDGSDVRVVVRGGLGLVAEQALNVEVAASQAACADGYVVSQPELNPGLVHDCETLLELRVQMFGHATVNWGPGSPIAQWAGVEITGTPQRVTGLRLTTDSTGRQLRNHPRILPSALARLSKLQVLDFSNVTGSIPPELGQLINLEVLRLSSSTLSGPIPPELGHLAQLRELVIWGHQLTGAIPPELGQLAQLQQLWIFGDQLTGSIPGELGQLTQLQEMHLEVRQLSGEIPPELGQLTRLQQLRVVGTQITGGIPPEFGHLTELTELKLSSNQLTGAIPREFGQLVKLTEIDLSFNKLTGEIPPELGHLPNLSRLDLFVNKLTGAIPRELGHLTNLRRLDLSLNQLTGEIPVELGELTNLSRLHLGHNQLTGTIPAELGRLVNLSVLDLRENQLTGTIPPEVTRLQRLNDLYVSGNQLTE